MGSIPITRSKYLCALSSVDRVPGYEPVGRRFESFRARQKHRIPNRGCGVFRVLQGENFSRALKSPSMPIRLPRDKVRMPPSGITERSEVSLQGATVFLIFLFCLRGAPTSPHAYIQLPASFRIQSDAFSCIFLANMLLLIYKCQKRQKEFSLYVGDLFFLLRRVSCSQESLLPLSLSVASGATFTPRCA